MPHHDAEAAAALVVRAEEALDGEDVAVRIASFDPIDRPVLWWPAAAPPSDAERAPDRRATVILNAANPAVKRLPAPSPRSR